MNRSKGQNKPKQIGVSLPEAVLQKLTKIAHEEGRSISGLCADAIIIHLTRWDDIPAAIPKERKKLSIFAGLTKNEHIQTVQESA